MENKKYSNSFEFDKSIDKETLQGLYDMDLKWIEENIETVLTTYDQDVSEIENQLASGDLSNLRKAVHKIKPAFGFVGMIKMQERCKLFEDQCSNASSIDQVKPDGKELLKEMQSSKLILVKELERLKAHNS